MNQRDFGIVCNCAIRYAIGRQTSVPSIVVSFITENKDKIDKAAFMCMKRDVEEALTSGNVGDPNIDRPMWEQFYEFLKGEV